MNLLDQIRNAKEVADSAGSILSSGQRLFGSRPVVDAPKAIPPVETEYAQGNQYPYQDPQRGAFSQIFNSGQNPMVNEFRKDMQIDYSDDRLRMMAKLKIAQMNLKADLKIEPIRIAASFAARKLGNQELADKLADMRLSVGFETFNDILQDAFFEELKDLQRAGNLRLPPVEELMSHRVTAAFMTIAGPGFENLVSLGESIMEKVKK